MFVILTQQDFFQLQISDYDGWLPSNDFIITWLSSKLIFNSFKAISPFRNFSN